MSLVLFKLPIHPRLSLGTFVGNVKTVFSTIQRLVAHKQVIFSVKSGHLKNEYIRELPHVVEREKAQGIPVSEGGIPVSCSP